MDIFNSLLQCLGSFATPSLNFQLLFLCFFFLNEIGYSLSSFSSLSIACTSPAPASFAPFSFLSLIVFCHCLYASRRFTYTIYTCTTQHERAHTRFVFEKCERKEKWFDNNDGRQQQNAQAPQIRSVSKWIAWEKHIWCDVVGERREKKKRDYSILNGAHPRASFKNNKRFLYYPLLHDSIRIDWTYGE